MPRTLGLVAIAAASLAGLLMAMRPDIVTHAFAKLRCDGPTYSFVRLVDAGDRVRFATVDVRDHDTARLFQAGGGDGAASFATSVATAAAGLLFVALEPSDSAVPDWLVGDRASLRRVVHAGCVAELAALGGPIGLIRRLAPGTPHRVATSAVTQRVAVPSVVPAGTASPAAEVGALGFVDAATVVAAGFGLDVAAVAAACWLVARRRRPANTAAE